MSPSGKATAFGAVTRRFESYHPSHSEKFNSPQRHMDFFKELILTYPTFAPVLFVIVRAISIVIPPVPGVAMDLMGIWAFGWVYGFILGESGTLLGSFVAFWLARKFREPLVRRVAPLRVVEEWEGKYSERQKFWALVGIRLVAIPLFDYISFAAGLTKLKWTTFLSSTLVGTLPTMFILYYFGDLAFNKGLYFGVAFIAGLFVLWLVYKKMNLGRYSKLWKKDKESDL